MLESELASPGRRSLVALAAAVIIWGAAGCGPENPGMIEGTSLRPEYQGLGCGCGTLMLSLSPERTFVMKCVPADEDRWGVPVADMQTDTLHVMRGSWESRGGDLTLVAAEASLVYTECEVEVDAHGETALLPGLCWLRGTESTFADSSSLVGRHELQEFLHPSEGSGSGSGL